MISFFSDSDLLCPVVFPGIVIYDTLSLGFWKPSDFNVVWLAGLFLDSFQFNLFAILL